MPTTDHRPIHDTITHHLNNQSHIHLAGPHGSGKTHALQYAAHQLNHDHIHLSCQNHQTQYRIYRHLLKHVTGSLPSNGKRCSDLHRELAQSLSAPVCIILDDIAHLAHHDDLTILKQLQQLDHVHITTATSNPDTLDDLRNDTIWTSHNPTPITINTPSPDETRSILTTALQNVDHLTDQTIATVADHTGNLQYALIYLDTILHHTDQNNPDRETIHSLAGHAQHTYRDHTLTPFTPHHHLLLDSIPTSGDNDTVPTADVIDQYQTRCDQTDVTPLSDRRIHTLLTDLELAGLITTHTESHGRHGRKRLVQFVALDRDA